MSTAQFFNIAGQRSALEHGIIEQTQPIEAVSTVKLLDRAIRQGVPIHDLDQHSYPATRPQLAANGWSTGELAELERYLNDGDRVLTPDNGDLAVDQWRGSAFLAISADQSTVSHIIGGGLKGAEGARVAQVNVQTEESGRKAEERGQSPLCGDGSRTFDYDPENRLTRVSQGGTELARYGYDPMGRRRSETHDGNTVRLLQAGGEVIAEYDEQGDLIKRIIPGPGLDEPIAYEVENVRRYLHADAIGSVIGVSDAGGVLVEHYGYGPFGETVGGSAVGNVRRYTARRYDVATGLYHYRNRAYSPALGRFLQPDPAGYADGLNLYAYVAEEREERGQSP